MEERRESKRAAALLPCSQSSKRHMKLKASVKEIRMLEPCEAMETQERRSLWAPGAQVDVF